MQSFLKLHKMREGYISVAVGLRFSCGNPWGYRGLCSRAGGLKVQKLKLKLKYNNDKRKSYIDFTLYSFYVI